MTNLVRGGIALVCGICVAGVLYVAGTWLGGVVGGLLTTIGAFYAPVVFDYLTRRGESAAAARKRLERVSVTAASPSSLGRFGPAALLRPDWQVVGFIHRPELGRLREWCTHAEAPQVLLLTGAGGVGKTRLSLQLAQDLNRLGWECAMIRPGEEADAVPAVGGVHSGQVLLVVDYAETRTELIAMLRAVAEAEDGKLKVLMLARSGGEWWEQLEASADATVRSVARAAARVYLPPFLADAAGVGDIFHGAVAAFADALGVAEADEVEVDVPGGPLPILVLHAAALLAVLDLQDRSQQGPSRVVADARVLDELLARERAFWLGAAQAANLTGAEGIDSTLAAQSVTVACLFAAADEAAGTQLLLRIPSLADSTSRVRRKIARWLRQLYPPLRAQDFAAAAGWWGSLLPDLVAERLVAGQLAMDDDLAAACLRGLDNDQANRVLTVLARASVHCPHAPGLMATALQADLEGLGIPFVVVAVQTGGPLGHILAAVLGDTTAPLETLIAIQQAIPDSSVTLAAADAIVTERIVQSLPEDTTRAQRARWADVLSARLAQVGKSEQSLAPAREAVALYRELVSGDPARYRPDLAAAVANLGVRLHQLGRPEDAAAAASEAVAIRRVLSAADPGDHLPQLAISLSNLSTDLAEQGKTAEALAAVQEAAEIQQQLAQDEPNRYLTDLAGTLVNLAATLARLGRAGEARTRAQEAAAIYWRAAGIYPDRFLPDLAAALTNLGALLADLGYPADALPAAEQGAALYRQLADVNPGRYRTDLAKSLNNLCTLLSALDRPAEALAGAENAVSVLRSAAAHSPGSARAELAGALSNLGLCLAALGRHADALPPTEEAVGIFSDLAEETPDRHRPDLALCLANLGIRLADLGRTHDARVATQDAVAIYRKLAADQPQRHSADLAGALNDLALRFLAAGRPSAALPVSREAVHINRYVAESDGVRHQPRLANSLATLGAALARAGRITAALTANEEAMAIYRALAGSGLAHDRAEHANALTNMADDLMALGRSDEALPHAEEATQVYRDAAQSNPGRFTIYLAASLETLARNLTMLDRPHEAIAARAEATLLRGSIG